MLIAEPELALLWLLRLEEMHVEELARREGVSQAMVIETCMHYGWIPPRGWTGRRPDMHERLVMWNHGMSWAEVAEESRYGGTWKTCATEVRAWAKLKGYPIRNSKPFGDRQRRNHG
jgi:hypothetical protein